MLELSVPFPPVEHASRSNTIAAFNRVTAVPLAPPFSFMHSIPNPLYYVTHQSTVLLQHQHKIAVIGHLISLLTLHIL